MSSEQSPIGSPTMTRFSPTKPINLSTENPDDQAKYKARQLRTIAQDRYTELVKLQSEWAVQENQYNQQCEELTSQLRDLEDEFERMKTEDQMKHIQQIQELKNEHKMQMESIQNQINGHLDEVADDLDEDIGNYDQQIESLKQQIANFDQEPELLLDHEEDAEETIARLEQDYENMLQMRDEAIQMKEDDSQETMTKIQTLIQKEQEQEQRVYQQCQSLLEQLNALEADHAEKVNEIRKEMEEEKIQNKNANRAALSKISQFQLRISQKQREHGKQIQELQNESDVLKTELESLTTRQRQQIKEATATAKTYAELKKRFVSKHEELKMLNSEKIREIIEHETLMKCLNQSDNLILTQMAASASASFNSSSRASRSSMFSSSHGSRI